MPELLLIGTRYDASVADRIRWDAGDSFVVANPEWASRHRGAAEAALRLLPNLPGHFWIATSGSSGAETGHIRWVGLSNDAVLASADAVNRHLSSSASDVWLHALPLFHVGGLGILARAFLSGATVAAGVGGSWDAAVFHARAQECAATLASLVPPQLHDLVVAGARAPRTLRALVVGGARLDPVLYKEARSLGWPCLPSYGLTETASQIATANLDSLSSPGCPVVLPMLGHAAARTDAAGALEVEATSLLTCYAEVVKGQARVWDPKSDGWLATGDLAVLSDLGIEVLGRATDSVKVLGETVWLEKVEEAARQWAAQEPAFAGLDIDLAVAALPHPRSGHELVLAIAGWQDRDNRNSSRSLFPRNSSRSLFPVGSANSFLATILMPYERPGRIVFLDAIPRTALGKCRRALLAEAVTAALPPRGEP